LAQSLHLKDSRKNWNRQPNALKERDNNVPQNYPKRQKNDDFDMNLGKQNLSSQRFQPSENYYIDKPKE
jgi:hypothetical protein